MEKSCVNLCLLYKDPLRVVACGDIHLKYLQNLNILIKLVINISRGMLWLLEETKLLHKQLQVYSGMVCG